MSPTEQELVARACDGDRAAFTCLYTQVQADVYRYCRYMADDHAEAEELFQETWLRVARQMAVGRRIHRFKPWVLTIATNLYRDSLRRKRLHRLFFIRDEIRSCVSAESKNESVVVPSSDSHEKSWHLNEALQQASKKLTSRQRNAFVLCYVQGCSILETAKILGVAEGTVKATLHRAVMVLRAELADR